MDAGTPGTVMRYAISLAYDGTDYHGWQRQPNAGSVQATLEAALSQVCRTSVYCTGCGRTDAGVHAAHYVAHFDVPSPLSEHFLSHINRTLPADIAVHAVWPVASAFNARFDAMERVYDYRLHTQKNPALSRHSTYWPDPPSDFDRAAMQAAAEALLRYRDFSCLCKAPDRHRTTLCDVREARFYFDEVPGGLRFRIRGNRFLRGMVRLTMMQLLRVGQGRQSPEDFETCLSQQQRPTHFLMAPPQGLTLTEVRYPPGLFQSKK